MAPLMHVPIAPLPPERFRAIFPPEQYEERLEDLIRRAREVVGETAVWNVSSTARGGGVAEMLHSLLGYARGAGIDARWAVIEGRPEFFDITKRIHNRLHGDPGDGGGLGDAERELYEATLFANAVDLAELIRPRDVVILHDPQTVGLVEVLKARGAYVIWRAHVGLDLPNELAREAWDFLIRYLHSADAYVFTRETFAWEQLDAGRVSIIPPSIDAFSPKNHDMDAGTAVAILQAAGVLSGRHAPGGAKPVFNRQDGTPGRVDRHAEIVQERPLRAGDRVVAQVSRWDHLKDPVGVIDAFAEHVAPRTDAHLVVAGPDVAAVADDPEGIKERGRAQDAWAELPHRTRERVHLLSLPMEDLEENAAIVNALQRHAAVVVQKSLAEGFGLTVSEAMWKGRPVVASHVGGIQDQIEDGRTGILVDPRDGRAFGDAVAGLLEDPERAEAIGRAARERVLEVFLVPRHLGQWVDLVQHVQRAARLPRLPARLRLPTRLRGLLRRRLR